tara:strand:+ start:11791 stop:13029 length:1239 start_codon:yes stop_codon:yes gene_type:complete
MSKNILFVHQHFPGQFKHIAKELSKNNNVHSISLHNRTIEGVTHHQYFPSKGESTTTHILAKEWEVKIIRAEGCANKAYELKNNGFNPDLIIGHPGWGELLFLKEVWPSTKILSYLEFHYSLYGYDIGFDDEESKDLDEVFTRRKLILRNSALTSQYENSDYFITPTEFQKSIFPDEIKSKLNVIHEGIDTDRFIPSDKEQLKVADFDLSKEKKIILFVNRNLEPYRGYHIFMRSLPGIFREHPDALVIIVGGESVSYGKKPEKGTTWRQKFFEEVKDSIDVNRVVYTGYITDHRNLTKLMQMATVQVYLTYPFVLSWSLLESLSCGLLVIGSNTSPVKEVITDGENGIIVDFFDYENISKKVNEVLSNPSSFDTMRKNARKKMIKNYDLKKICLPKTLNLINDILEDKDGG